MSPGTTTSRRDGRDRLAVAPHARARRGGGTQRLECALGSVAGHDIGAHDRDQAGQDEQAVADLAEKDRQHAGGEQQQDERLGRRLEDELAERGPGWRLELVPARDGGPPRDLGRRQADLPLDIERSGPHRPPAGHRPGPALGFSRRWPPSSGNRSRIRYDCDDARLDHADQAPAA